MSIDLAGRVRELESQARSHKREVGFHRSALRKTMEELNRLRAECEAHGILFIHENHQGIGERSQSHDDYESST